MKTILNVEQLEAKKLLTTTTYTTDDVEVFADGEHPNPSEQTVEQWAYTNTDNGKINWYIYSQDMTSNNLDRLKHVKKLNVKFSEYEDAGVGLYFTIYTAPQNDGQDASSWYRSRLNFTGDYTYNGDSSVDIDVTQAFAKLKKDHVANKGRPGNYKVGLNLDPYSSRGPMDGNEILSYIAISTSSGQQAATENWAIETAKITLKGRPNLNYNFVTVGENDNISSDDNFEIINTSLLDYQVTIAPTSPYVAQGFTNFVITGTYDSGLRVWDDHTDSWVNPATPPTTSNPTELLRLMELRIIEEGDVVMWEAPEGSTGSTPVFDYVGWNPVTQQATPISTVFAELGTNA